MWQFSEDHPYAKVIRDDSEDPETDTDNYDDPKAITKEKRYVQVNATGK